MQWSTHDPFGISIWDDQNADQKVVHKSRNSFLVRGAGSIVISSHRGVSSSIISYGMMPLLQLLTFMWANSAMPQDCAGAGQFSLAVAFTHCVECVDTLPISGSGGDVQVLFEECVTKRRLAHTPRAVEMHLITENCEFVLRLWKLGQ